jgi:hypothetical protein
LVQWTYNVHSKSFYFNGNVEKENSNAPKYGTYKIFYLFTYATKNIFSPQNFVGEHEYSEIFLFNFDILNVFFILGAFSLVGKKHHVPCMSLQVKIDTMYLYMY